MFYPIDQPQPTPGVNQATAHVILNTAQSRRLVAKGAVSNPIVQNAYNNGMVIIARGITNAYVSEEFFNISIENKTNQTAGFVGEGATNATSTPPPCTWHVIEKGKVLEDADSNVEAAFELVKSLKDEPALGMPDARKISNPADYDYDPQAQLDTLEGL